MKGTIMVVGRSNRAGCCGMCASVSVMFLLLFLCWGSASGQTNVALNKPYTYSPVPNYPLTTESGDSAQLTNGLRTTTSRLWTDPLSVGWMHVPDGVVTITIDLGVQELISGGSFSTAFGSSGVTSPFAVYMLVSDTGGVNSYYLVDDLILASAENGIPYPSGYMTHSYTSTDLPCRGRYVRFIVVGGGTYIMCDEVEVFAGSAGQVDLPRGLPILDDDIDLMIAGRKLTTVVKGRLAMDLYMLEQLPGFGSHPTLWQSIDGLPTVSTINWREGVPYNSLHRNIWAYHAAWARNELGSPSDHLLVWSQGCWDNLHPFDLPTLTQVSQAKVEVEMIRNEYRSAALNLTNISDNSQVVELECGYDGDGPGEVLTVREVIHVETQGRRIVANGLPEASTTASGWQVEVPAGSTRQVFLTFNSSGSPAGEFTGNINVSCSALGISRLVPFRLEIHPADMPAVPTLSMTTWDYCHDGGYIRYESTWKSAIELMKDYSFLCPWVGPGTIPWPNPSAGEVDGSGNIVGTLDWSVIDEWIGLWGSDAKQFMFYLGENTTVPFTGYTLDSPEGQNEMTQFFTLLAERFQLQGISADKIVICPRDEPYTQDKDNSIIAWAGVIHGANAAIKVFTDPIWADPTGAVPELFTAADIVCPKLSQYPPYGAGGSFVDFYDAVRDSGKILWTYQCNGPVKELSSYSYFRLEAWHAFLHGMTGAGFWALADAGHKPAGVMGSWNDFTLGSGPFSIMYWDENGVTPSKQMEALRESIEDYEYLVMLNDAIDSAASDVFTGRAEIALYCGVKRACRATGYDVADFERLQVLEQLLDLQSQ